MCPTIRSNTVTITDNSQTIKSITYVPHSKVVSKGQPHDGPPQVSGPNSPGNTFNIVFNVGREGTSHVAKKFVDLTQGAFFPTTISLQIENAPSDLNFFFGVQFTLGDSDPPLTYYLGQGSALGQNNWWLGGPGVRWMENGPSQLVLPSVTLNLIGDGDSGFLLSSQSDSSSEE